MGFLGLVLRRGPRVKRGDVRAAPLFPNLRTRRLHGEAWTDEPRALAAAVPSWISERASEEFCAADARRVQGVRPWMKYALGALGWIAAVLAGVRCFIEAAGQ